MERLYNHVGDLGNICAGIGFAPGNSRLGALKERLLQLNQSVAGHRYLMGCIMPGGLRGDLRMELAGRSRQELLVIRDIRRAP